MYRVEIRCWEKYAATVREKMKGILEILKEKFSVGYDEIFVEIIPIKKDDVYNDIYYAKKYVFVTIPVPENTSQSQKEKIADEITHLLCDFYKIKRKYIIIKFEDIKKENIFWEY